MQAQMKKLSTFFILTLVCSTLFAQTIFTYGNASTSEEEFLKAYNKNKPTSINKEKAIREYLELYTNFKLKVKAAEELRLDTISQIRYDVQNFREQVIENYLNDEKGMQFLLDEALERSTKDIHVLFFSVPVAKDALPADTQKAFNAAKELYNNLKTSSAYSEVTTNISAKFTPAKFADLGFITCFLTPYEYENIFYNTKVGNVSEPYRNNKGWTIFKVIEQRPAVGKWKAAQILFAYPPNADYESKLAVKSKADSVHSLLVKGMSFTQAAKQFSDDRNTNQSGGELQEFGTGKYNTIFSNNVFSLKTDNDFGKPFETTYGYHIVKRLGHTPIPSDKTDAGFIYDVKQKVLQDERINAEKEKFAKEIATKTGYKKIASVKNNMLFSTADSMMKTPAMDNANSFPLSKMTIATFKDGSAVKGNQWLQFVKDYKSNVEVQAISNEQLLNKFSERMVVDYYKKHLEEYNNDFKYQMQEFKEGNMLFEIMERMVWSKAGADSVGLKKYYEANKQTYKWAASADVIVFNCPNEKMAKTALAQLKEGKRWSDIVLNSDNQIQADSGRYDASQIPVVSQNASAPTANSFSEITKNADSSCIFVNYLKLYEANMQRSFAEARGLVINDYQNVLEQQWITGLRKKYPIKNNEAVISQIIK
jgi:peptidyl-prolyl cis-trans isomerase SurA